MILLSSELPKIMIINTRCTYFPRLSQLPYLDAKHEYLWSHFSISDVVCPPSRDQVNS